MSFEVLSFIIGAIGTISCMIGLGIAYIQWKQTNGVERLRKEQLAASINRAKYLIIPNNIIETIHKEDTPNNQETLRQ